MSRDNESSSIVPSDGEDNEIQEQDSTAPDWQKAKHESSKKDLEVADESNPLNVVRGETGSIEQKLEDDVVLDYLANQIYGGPAETIKEYIANSETACIRAAELELENQGFTDDEIADMKPREVLEEASYSPTIEVEWHRDEDLLVVQDNGIGFTPREVTDVLAYTGRSGVRDRGDVSGQFGMGVLSAHNAVGKEGTYTLFSRTRRDVNMEQIVRDLHAQGQYGDVDVEELLDLFDLSDTGFAAYCYLGGYDPMDEKPPEGFYGTRFELALQDGIEEEYSGRRHSDPAIRRWVAEKSEWTRVPVLYTEYKDGETTYDDEYGLKEFAEDHDGAILTIDNDAFTAKCYPSASNETLLLSIPIDRNERRNPDGAPWSVDIRFHNENGPVVECNCRDEDHEGLMPVDEAEYRGMSDERKELFVPKQDVRDDITAPVPQANRETLQKNSSFWDWLGTQFKELYHAEVERLVTDLDDRQALMDLAEDDPQEFSFLMTAVDKFKGYRSDTVGEIQDDIEQRTGVQVPDEVARTLLVLLKKIEHCPRGRSGVSKKRSRTSEKVWRIFREAHPDANVYIGATINEDRCAVVWETHEDAEVAYVDGVSEYDQYQNNLDFKLLKNVPKSEGKNEGSFTIPDKLKSRSGGGKNNAGKDAGHRDLTLRTSSGRRTMENFRTSHIKDVLEEYHNSSDPNTRGLKLSYSTYATKLVLFPSNADKSMSEWYDITNPYNDMAVASCTVASYEYLKGTPGVMHIDDLLQESEEYKITTNEGDMTVAEAGSRLCVHVVDSEYLERFRDEKVMESLSEWLYEYLSERTGDISYRINEEDWPDDFVYAPVGKEAWQKLYPSNLEHDFMVIGGNLRPRGSDWTWRFSSDARIYANGRLYKWDNDTPEVKATDELSSSADADTAFSVVDSLAMLHDNGVKPASEQPTGPEEVSIEAVQQATLEPVADGGE